MVTWLIAVPLTPNQKHWLRAVGVYMCWWLSVKAHISWCRIYALRGRQENKGVFFFIFAARMHFNSQSLSRLQSNINTSTFFFFWFQSRSSSRDLWSYTRATLFWFVVTAFTGFMPPTQLFTGTEPYYSSQSPMTTFNLQTWIITWPGRIVVPSKYITTRNSNCTVPKPTFLLKVKLCG